MQSKKTEQKARVDSGNYHPDMKVKICGITNLGDALAAVDFGVDALGFIFAAESPRHVAPASVAEIIKKLPPFVTTVAVFTSATEKEISNAIGRCGIDLIQFHGDFPETLVLRFSHRAIQVVKVKDEGALDAVRQTTPVRAFLLDTYHEKMAGGSGVTFNWEIARKAASLGKIIMAGGLTPDNVQEAIRQARPYGVDVSSGVEAKKGKKDHQKMKRFIAAAKEMEGMGAASE